MPDTSLLHVVVNPSSGNGRAAKRWPQIARVLEANGYRCEVAFTSGPDHATRLARQFVQNGAHTIVAIGGDGTVNEIVNGMIEADPPTDPAARLLVIPCGTGRDLGRTLGTGKVDTAVAALRAGTTSRMDVGRIRFRSLRGHTETRYFANVADLGLGAAVAHRINHSSKALGGLVTYLLAAVRTIVAYSPTDITVDVGDDRIYEAPANMVVLANGQYFAGGMHVAPSASICDGLLELYILADVGKRTLLTSLLPRVYRGKHVGRAGVLHVRASSATIQCPSGMHLEMDGEQVGTAPVEVDVLPRVLPVIVHADTLRPCEGCASNPI